MHTVGCRITIAAFCVAAMAAGNADAQPRPQRDTVLAARRDSLERELQKIAVIDRKLMVPMRDGAKMQFDVYRPKNATGPVPAIFVRTPYNMSDERSLAMMATRRVFCDGVGAAAPVSAAGNAHRRTTPSGAT